MGRRNIRVLPSLAEKKSTGYYFAPLAAPAASDPANQLHHHLLFLNRLTTASGSPCDNLTSTPAASSSRLPWLDYFRGLAVLVMIETHVSNTFLASDLRDGAWFSLLNYANGLVAPSFLFIAGFVQGRERRVSPNKPINYRRRAFRLLGIGMVGYALHFPFLELEQHRCGDALRVGSQFDVLQCLALALGTLLGLSWLVGKLAGPAVASDAAGSLRLRRAAWWGGVVSLAAIAILGAPLVAGWTGGPVLLRALINQTTGSLFPVLPWAGFVLLGALVGASPPRAVHERSAGLLGLTALAWACRGEIFSAVSPAFFLERAAWVLALAAICEWRAARPLPPWVLFAGRQSLTLYVVHLVLISTLVGIGLPVATLTFPLTLTLLAALAAVSLAATLLIARLRRGDFFGGLQPVAGAKDAIP